MRAENDGTKILTIKYNPRWTKNEKTTNIWTESQNVLNITSVYRNNKLAEFQQSINWIRITDFANLPQLMHHYHHYLPLPEDH